jgi:hypothetical protein
MIERSQINPDIRHGPSSASPWGLRADVEVQTAGRQAGIIQTERGSRTSRGESGSGAVRSRAELAQAVGSPQAHQPSQRQDIAVSQQPHATAATCVYRKLKPGRNGDEARRVSGVNE